MPMLPQNLKLNVCQVYIQVEHKVKAELQAVQERPAAQPALESEPADKVRQRIRWIGQHQDHSFRSCLEKLRKDFVVDIDVRIEQSQPARWIVAVGCAAALFIRSGGDHDKGRAGQI